MKYWPLDARPRHLLRAKPARGVRTLPVHMAWVPDSAYGHVAEGTCMSAETGITIAGIDFVLTCREAVISNDVPELYKPFYRRGCPEDAGSFPVNISPDLPNIPQTETIRKIFDSGQSWSMFQDEAYYYISLDPSAIYDTMRCHATFDRGITRATLYSDDRVQRADGKTEVRNPFCYPLDQILLMYVLAGRKGALIHAAGMSMHGRGYIFPGRSGAGKSTLSRLFLDREQREMLSDDRIVVRKTGNGFNAFGTPWAGDAGIAENKDAPLAGIFFIHQSSDNRIQKISPDRAMEKLMPVLSIPWYDEAVISGILSNCEEFVLEVPAYELHCRPDKGLVEFFEKFVSA